jgi:CxxC-x17-CxxC domain-containing protein
MAKDITYIAQTNFREANQKFGIRRPDRRQHMYVIGKTGTGKTQFLKNMALQDVENGEGLAVIDPHGEFVEEILESIPRHRMKDVVYFNPADMEYPVSFNIMDVQDPRYKHLIASGLIGIFTKIWANVWSARMEYILANSILALLDTPGTTLLGIPRMLVDRDYRQKIINNLQDPVVKSFWINEYEEWESRYRNEAIAPVQNKVGQFLNVSFVRNIVGQAKNTIDIEEIMNTGKILLVNVSKGRIGEDNSAILGAMIITKIQLSAMERVRIPEADRRDFYLYVDEFQNFATDSFRNILSEARKYRLNLIMAHQYIGQLVIENNTAVRDAVFGNVGTEVSFRVGAEDAEFLEKEFTPEFLQDDFVRLANRDIYIKLMISGITSRPFSAKTITIPTIVRDDKKRNDLINFTREKYARSKQAVEDEINRWASNLDVSSKGVMPIQWQNNQKQSQGHKQQDGTMLYDAVCSSCGKKTKVVFEPTSGKPVYCKSCFKKRKEEGFDRNEQLNESHLIPAKQVLARQEIHEPDSALADLGIEFDSGKTIKKTGQKQFQQNQQQNNQPKMQASINIENVNVNLSQQEKKQDINSTKIENIDFKSSHHQKDNYQENYHHQSQPQKREINLAELRKVLAESLEKEDKEKLKEEKKLENVQLSQQKLESKIENKIEEVVKEKINMEMKARDKETDPILPDNHLNLIGKENKLEPLVSQPQEVKPLDGELEIKPETKLELESQLQNQWPELKPKQELVPKVENPDEELKKRIAQEKMSDEIQKNLAIDFSDYDPKKKGIIKPGQTIKF